MVCPNCGRELTKKNVVNGRFSCKCGWGDSVGEFEELAKSAEFPKRERDGEWLPDTNSTLLH